MYQNNIHQYSCKSLLFTQQPQFVSDKTLECDGITDLLAPGERMVSPSGLRCIFAESGVVHSMDRGIHYRVSRFRPLCKLFL